MIMNFLEIKEEITIETDGSKRYTYKYIQVQSSIIEYTVVEYSTVTVHTLYKSDIHNNTIIIIINVF